MIDRTALLSDLQTLLKRLEADLLERSESADVPDVGQTLRAEYERANNAERTAENYEDWRSGAITQSAAAWVLSCVFVRFLEDNKLIDPPKIAGPNERLQQARDEHELYFHAHPKETDREYLLSVFDALGKQPGTRDVFGPHNPLRELPKWLSGDAAGELLRFFQKIDANTGVLVHDFTDPAWDTRFLGDLYQDLSEGARKKYALLQTPEFVEEFILDRTLDLALDEFGLDAPSVNDKDGKAVTEAGFRMIDPACGSGHFLLGSFRRILDRWEKIDPTAKCRVVVQRALDSIYGVDVNPYAVAIARFRLLVAALAECGIMRLADAPAFHINVACGDSLYHGRQRQQQLGDWTDEAHYFQSEDAPALRRILREGTYHVVVANPPYITPKDRAANEAYRQLYASCKGKYSLAVPFVERVILLAVSGSGDGKAAGYTGQITANSFMKREFGKKLIEEYLPTVDLTHVIDSSLVHIPDYGTPTAILFARNRKPVGTTIRLAGAIKREDSQPVNPAQGLVWRAIVEQIDLPGSQSAFISVSDSERRIFYLHPWSIGGGGASELKVALEAFATTRLDNRAEVGVAVVTLEDDAFLLGRSALLRARIPPQYMRRFIVGDAIRDWSIHSAPVAIFPHDPTTLRAANVAEIERLLWPEKTILSNRLWFGKTQIERGLMWFEYGHISSPKLQNTSSIIFSLVATHNQFSRDCTGAISNQGAPMIKLLDRSDRAYSAVLGCLNSSTGAFWLRQVCHDKGGGGVGGGIAAEGWERFREYDNTKLRQFPLPDEESTLLSQTIDGLSRKWVEGLPDEAIRLWSQQSPGDATRASLQYVLREWELESVRVRGEMLRRQEDLDWECYRLYGLIGEAITYRADWFPIVLGQRAFEIVLARKMARGEVQTTWFERHGSTPITELPAEWPDDYRRLVERRIEVIESNPNIALIEQPEYKRRWNTEPWEEQVEKALRSWLLDRLESYFDFDGRMAVECGDASSARVSEPAEVRDRRSSGSAQPHGGAGDLRSAECAGSGDPRTAPPLAEIALVSVARLADVASQDTEFHEVGALLRDDPAFDVYRLLADLVAAESVPLLPILRYKPSGLRKRTEWEKSWELQREEDEVNLKSEVPTHRLQIPVPPKYTSADFISSGGARYWSLRGKLDVPKERWVSFPHCEGPDGTLVIAWAGYDHLQLARAISAYFVDIQERLGGRDDPRLVPLLACIIELLPWLKQWHHDLDLDYNQRMDEVYEGFVTEEAKNLGLTIDEIKAWQPPQRAAGRGRRRATT